MQALGRQAVQICEAKLRPITRTKIPKQTFRFGLGFLILTQAVYIMVHYMNLKKQPFEMIKSGHKTIELRLFDEKRSLIETNDEIVFNFNDETLTVKVLALHRFENFDTLYKTLDLLKCGYLPEELKTAKADDMNIYYPPEKQQKYGVVGIEIEVM